MKNNKLNPEGIIRMNRLNRSMFLYFFIFIIASHSQAQNIYTETRNNVGDILFDPKTDDPTFELIAENNILTTNTLCGFLIKGERYMVLKYFDEHFKPDVIKGVTGYITIRFIVNHKGQTDRFRMYEMDNNYKPFTFPKNITDSLLELTRKLDGWITTLNYKSNRYNYIETEVNGEKKYAYDYYQYILFKIKDGQIETVLP